ncbi:MAG: hypothetical protein ACD_4C00414G0001 [uncultured bacterium (gcode 4)]|uniref:Uncharacterized protein n=1 Tax=uncultured bacterium (gcode 4) TaxID=1234023 RepID=K2FTF8_9BACT|nr:MAG: hypothetical protein ACD_4C00414G0001 [uncultured bacterium (gcode 4)]
METLTWKWFLAYSLPKKDKKIVFLWVKDLPQAFSADDFFKAIGGSLISKSSKADNFSTMIELKKKELFRKIEKLWIDISADFSGWKSITLSIPDEKFPILNDDKNLEIILQEIRKNFRYETFKYID